MTTITSDSFSKNKTNGLFAMLLRKIAGMVLFGIAVIMFISLMTHDPRDPNLLNLNTVAVNNLTGYYGAVFAGSLVLALGLGAYTLPLCVLCYALRLFYNHGLKHSRNRILFFPVFMALSALMLASIQAEWLLDQQSTLGGFVGHALFTFFTEFSIMQTPPWDMVFAISLYIITLSVGLFTLSFTRAELRALVSRSVVALFGMIRQPVNKRAEGKEYANKRVKRAEVDNLTNIAPVKDNLFSRVGRFSFPSQERSQEQAQPTPKKGQSNVSSRIQEAIRRHKRRTQPQQEHDRQGNDLFADIDPTLIYDDKDAISPPPLIATRSIQAPKSRLTHPDTRPAAQSQQAKAEAQPNLFEPSKQASKQRSFETPALSLLESPSIVKRQQLSEEAMEENARLLESVLDDYGVRGEIISIRPGPVVTLYELEPAPGLKASRVIGLADDIARSMSALAARVSTVPGRNVIGIELPNDLRETVYLREILSTRDYGDGKHALPFALGKDIAGRSSIVDLAKMPHLLIAGTTGSGKSVAINTMILSLLYKLSPEDCRLIMIDPKMLELSVYDGIPHLLSPVVTDPKKAVVALKWVVGEMEERYRKMSKMGVRNAASYNTRVKEALSKNEMFERTVQTGFDADTGEPIFETERFTPEKMPYIVIIVDEMADLMMVAGKEIEACIQRLAQMARASGIHLVMATQRPSVDVITGTIKANFPTRMSFQVTSKIDSRTILGEMGAEQLLGMGDMLYMEGGGRITRVHSPFVSDEEVEEVVNHLKTFGPPEYVAGVQSGPCDDAGAGVDLLLGLGGNTDKEGALYDQAVAIVAQDRKCSTSYIQRKLSIGYNKAAKLVEEMEENGMVSSANHVGKREVLVPNPNEPL